MITKTLTNAIINMGVGRKNQEDACLVFDEILQSNDVEAVKHQENVLKQEQTLQADSNSATQTETIAVKPDQIERKGRGDLPVQLFAVADGMGGKGIGDIASNTVLQSLRYDIEKYSLSPDYDEIDFADLADMVSENADHAVRSRLSAFQGLPVGTTLSWLMIKNDEAYTFSIGNSRIYLFRDDKLYRITHDHQLPASEGGRLELFYGYRRQEGRLIPDNLNKLSLKKDDILMLTTDGLTKFVQDSKIEEIMNQPDAFAGKAQRLLDTATESGCNDNTALVAIKIQSFEELKPPQQTSDPQSALQKDKSALSVLRKWRHGK